MGFGFNFAPLSLPLSFGFACFTATLPDGWSRHGCHRGGNFASILPCDGTFGGSEESGPDFAVSLLELFEALRDPTLVTSRGPGGPAGDGQL